MREDLSGLFWNDPARVSGTGYRPMPTIPDTGWRPPAEFPRLDSAKLISVDTETKDPCLTTEGPGWARGKGHIVGLAIGTDDGHRWYFPMRHEVGSGNMDPATVMKWARRELSREHQPKVFANALYDLGWLAEEGVDVAGQLIDVQIAEPLINENAFSYSLDSLSSKYLNTGKVDEVLYDWCARAYGGKPSRSQADNIYRAPPSLVGPYAEGDVDLPLRIWEHQKKILEAEGLLHLFDIESRLIRMLHAMRRRGVRVDVSRAKQIDDEFSSRIDTLERSLGGINVNAAADLELYAKRRGLEIQRTEKGNPSFAGLWVEQNMPDVHEVRKLMKARDTFIRGYMLKLNVDGRVHCQFNQLRSDEYGTVSGRFSSSNPNLQNIPARDEEIGPLIRSLYLPDGDDIWTRFDWSQIEFRLLVHHGVGPTADVARSMYWEDPKTDFHVMVADLTGIPRKPAKNINFGLVYGMGEETMAENLGRSLAEVKPLFETYHGQLPFVRETFDQASKTAARRGYIKTLLGRRRRFDLWEPARWMKDSVPLPYDAALKEYGAKIRRAKTHKALNGALQGAAADIMKLAMVQIWESGVCDPAILGAPLLTVHDELDWSKPRTLLADEAIIEVHHIMENCFTLKVPLIAEREEGPNWGSLEKYRTA